MTYVIRMNVEVTEDAIEDIIDGAGMAIGYWASKAVVDTEGKTYEVTDGEENQKYHLTYPDIARAIQLIVDRDVDLRSDIVDAIALDLLNYEDAHRIDSEAYDAIIQVACFADVIYG
jgi:hypothetical protein